MTRNAIWLVIALGLSQVVSQAQFSISYSGTAGQSNVVDSTGLPVNGDVVSIGTFAPGYDPTAHEQDLPSLQANWINFDSTVTITVAAIDGRFTATSQPVQNPAFDGKQIYLFITQTSGSVVMEYGLFSSSSPDWIFPASTSTTTPNPINSNEVNQFLFGDGLLYESSLNPGSLQTLTVPVPEPGGLALVGVGLVVGQLWRRRSG